MAVPFIDERYILRNAPWTWASSFSLRSPGQGPWAGGKERVRLGSGVAGFVWRAMTPGHGSTRLGVGHGGLLCRLVPAGYTQKARMITRALPGAAAHRRRRSTRSASTARTRHT